MSQAPKIGEENAVAGKRVAKNAAVLYARMAVTVSLSLLSTRLVLSALGILDFGIYSLVAGLVAMSAFLTASMSSTSLRFIAYEQGAGRPNLVRKLFNVSLGLHVIVAAVIFGFLECFSFIIFSDLVKVPPDSRHLAWTCFQLVSLATVFGILGVAYDAVINSHENMTFFAVLGIVEAILKIAVALTISAAPSNRLLLYSCLSSTSSAVLLVLRVVYCHSKYSECHIESPRLFDFTLLKKMSAFAGWSFLGTSTSIVANYGQGLLLNNSFGTVANAAQGIANQVSGQLGAFANALLRALNPMIVRSEGAGNRALMFQATSIGSKTSFLLLLLFYVPTIFALPDIFRIWLHSTPDYSVAFCRLLLLRNLIEQLHITVAASIAAVGNIRQYQISTGIINILALPACVCLFQIGFGPTTLYVIFIVHAVFTLITVLHYANKLFAFPVKSYLRSVIVPCIVTATCCFLSVQLFDWLFAESRLKVVLLPIVSVACFALSTWYVALISAERSQVRKVLLLLSGKTMPR